MGKLGKKPKTSSDVIRPSILPVSFTFLIAYRNGMGLDKEDSFFAKI